MSDGFYPLQVNDTQIQCDGAAKSLAFEVPESLRETFSWRPGQHITLRFTLKGEEHRRSYSICASALAGEPLSITVKRVPLGIVSNHINDTVKAGDEIEVMPPFGSFCLDANEKERRTLYFFGAGSGITPLYAMIHSALCAEPYSQCHLVYGSKNEKDILLQDALEALIAQYGGRLSVDHVLSEQSLFSAFKPWRTGRVDQAAIDALIEEKPPYAQDAQYFVCGPGIMNADVKAALLVRDVPANRIHMESYGGTAEPDLSVKGISATIDVTMNGITTQIPVGENQTLLEAARAAGLNSKFSCQSGVCGACRARLESGKVHMRARMALEDDEIDAGAVLTCQAVALTPELKIEFER
ncbi:MAG: 2Fe-2S iron-sulfur cluster-binding protein [Hyphomicrobiales bacterium]